MNFQEYRPLALRTCKMLGDPMRDLKHAAMGLMTEGGELMSEFKRVEIYEKVFDNDMRAHAIEELGDFQWYIPVALMAAGVDPDTAAIDDDVLKKLDTLTSTAEVGLCMGLVGNVLTITLIAPNEDTQPRALDDDARNAIAHACALLNYLVDHLAGMLGTTGDEVRRLNIEKLRKRYPERYTDAAAEARADKGGLDARNS